MLLSGFTQSKVSTRAQMHMVDVKGVGKVPPFPKTYPFVTIKGYFFYHILKGYFRNTYTATYIYLQGFL